MAALVLLLVLLWLADPMLTSCYIMLTIAYSVCRRVSWYRSRARRQLSRRGAHDACCLLAHAWGPPHGGWNRNVSDRGRGRARSNHSPVMLVRFVVLLGVRECVAVCSAARSSVVCRSQSDSASSFLSAIPTSDAVGERRQYPIDIGATIGASGARSSPLFSMFSSVSAAGAADDATVAEGGGALILRSAGWGEHAAHGSRWTPRSAAAAPLLVGWLAAAWSARWRWLVKQPLTARSGPPIEPLSMREACSSRGSRGPLP